MDKDTLLIHLQECITSGESYRDKFKPVWEEVEEQIRCEPPSAWDKKEDWQTKIFIPLQAKTEEIAIAYLNKMICGKRRFFDILGVEKADHEDAQQLTNLIDGLLELGKFRKDNNFILTEAIGSPGTSFNKVLLGKDGLIKFNWRSPYNVLIDPECGHDLSKARFIIDCYKKDIAYIIAQGKKGGLYEKGTEEIVRFLNDKKLEAKSLEEKTGKGSTGTSESMMTIKGIDGTEDIEIPAKYKTVDVHECWVEVPKDDGTYEERLCTVLNQRYLLRDEENIYGIKMFVGCRTKPRKYDYYGRGFLENCRGLQELSNSMVNLGFDSAKISAMDIIILDDTKVKDSTTIKYKPLAVWKMKDVNAVKIQRQPISAIMDIIKGLQLIDQIHQEATGSMRQLQSAPELGGESDTGKTLGEYQLKLQAIDQRFLDIGRFIETDYIIPLIRMIFKIIVNPKLFDQAKVDRILGMKEIDDIQPVQELDPMTQQPTTIQKVVGRKEISKLDLEKIRKQGEMAFDFKAVGITQFSERLETLQKLKEGLMAALSNPTLTAMTKVDLLWKKLWQVSEIDDYDEFLRTKDEVKQLLTEQMQMMPPPGMPGLQGGQPNAV